MVEAAIEATVELELELEAEAEAEAACDSVRLLYSLTTHVSTCCTPAVRSGLPVAGLQRQVRAGRARG